MRWALFSEVTPAWLAHPSLVTSDLWWQLEPSCTLLSKVMRALLRQVLMAGLPKISDVSPVMPGHSCKVPILMGMWAFSSEVPKAGLLKFSWCGALWCEFTPAWIP